MTGCKNQEMSDGDGKKKLFGAQNRKRKLEKELCLKNNTSSIEKFILRPGLSSEEHRDLDPSTLPLPSSPPLPLVVQESEEPPCAEVFPDNTIIREDVLNDLALWPQVLTDKQRTFLVLRGPIQVIKEFLSFQ